MWRHRTNFHQIRVRYNDRDVLRFLWREHMSDPIQDFKMNVHLFRKIDLPCIANWTLQKAVTDNKDQISFRSSHAYSKIFIWTIILIPFQQHRKQ